MNTLDCKLHLIILSMGNDACQLTAKCLSVGVSLLNMHLFLWYERDHFLPPQYDAKVEDVNFLAKNAFDGDTCKKNSSCCYSFIISFLQPKSEKREPLDTGPQTQMSGLSQLAILYDNYILVQNTQKW